MNRLSQGYLKSLTLLSITYGLFETTKVMRSKDISSNVSDATNIIKNMNIPNTTPEDIDTLIDSYIEGLKVRVNDFMMLPIHKPYNTKLHSLTVAMFNTINDYIHNTNDMEYDMVALYILYEIQNKDNISKEIKNVIAYEEIEYIFNIIRCRHSGIDKYKNMSNNHNIANGILLRVL